jgi:hypothetical protein
MDGRSVKRRRIYAAGFLVAWLALIVVVGVTARETQQLTEEQNTAVLANQDKILAEEQQLIETSLASVCGEWRGTYAFLSAWTRSNDAGLTTVEAEALRTAFKRSYNRWCSDYPVASP